MSSVSEFVVSSVSEFVELSVSEFVVSSVSEFVVSSVSEFILLSASEFVELSKWLSCGGIVAVGCRLGWVGHRPCESRKVVSLYEHRSGHRRWLFCWTTSV